MKISQKLTKRLIEEILSRGIGVSLDIAGSFIPGWPLIKPILTKVLEDLPGDITGKYISSEDNVDKIIKAFEKNDILLEPITKAFQEVGISEDWAQNTLGLIQQVSDDVLEGLANQKLQDQRLETITSILEEMTRKKGARLELRSQVLEYIDYLIMPVKWMEGWHLAPGSVLEPSLPGRHLPLGWMNWDFQTMNSGGQLATVKKIVMMVEEELPCPDEVSLGGAKPAFDHFEDVVVCEPGATAYPLFNDKLLKYSPENDVDDFRIHIDFNYNKRIIQKLKLAIHWQDGTGGHTTYGPSLFICSNA